jgi:hypothetical protein
VRGVRRVVCGLAQRFCLGRNRASA